MPIHFVYFDFEINETRIAKQSFALGSHREAPWGGFLSRGASLG